MTSWLFHFQRFILWEQGAKIWKLHKITFIKTRPFKVKWKAFHNFKGFLLVKYKKVTGARFTFNNHIEKLLTLLKKMKNGSLKMVHLGYARPMYLLLDFDNLLWITWPDVVAFLL